MADASRTSFAKAKSLLKPYPEELMDAHDVSTVVNSAKYDGPECIRSISGDERAEWRSTSNARPGNIHLFKNLYITV